MIGGDQDEACVAAEAPVAVREARGTDVPALLALHRAALEALGLQHYSAAQVASLLRHVRTLDDALLADRTYYVAATAGGALVACGGWSGRAPGYGDALAIQPAGAPQPARAALIRAMYTHPDWARRGLGRRILDAAEAGARRAGVEEIELDALLGGVPLYLSAGYLALETSQARLPDGISLPVVRMRKRLRPRG